MFLQGSTWGSVVRPRKVIRLSSLRVLIVAVVLSAASGCATTYDGPGIFGGTSDKKVADNRYVITATVNGYTAPSAVKELVVRRAQQVAIKEGYASFRIVAAQRILFVDGSRTDAGVEFSHNERLDDAQAYRVCPGSYPCPTPFGKDLDLRATAQLAATFSRKGIFSWESYTPYFVDVLAAERDAVGGETLTVPSGEQVVVVAVALNRTGEGGPWRHLVPIKANLSPGGNYRIEGEVSEAEVAVWIQEVASRESVSSKERLRYKLSPPTSQLPLR